ncbi:MAG: SAM-dependent methyltransferase [Arenicella sp.]|jgi:SAM-dependent methyltransferase
MRNRFLRIRRSLLKTLVPEFIWPREVDIDGVIVKLRGAPYSFSIKRLLSKDSDAYERAERGFLDNLKKGDHVLEFGSSIGILTALICERVPEGKVVSVEASSSLVDYSSSWLSRYEYLTLVKAAAFPLYDRLDLSLSFDDSSGSLGGIVDYNKADSSASKLSSFFISDCEAMADFRPTVMVIDIEGSEDIILSQDMNLPDTIDRIIFELHSFIYGKETEKKIIARVQEQGFELVKRAESVYLFARKRTLDMINA